MTYNINGTIIKTENCTKSWAEATRWDGNNRISVPTGKQWDHQELFRSQKGRYYIVHSSEWQGSTPHAEWVTSEAATVWLLANGHDDDMPEDLAAVVPQVSE